MKKVILIQPPSPYLAVEKWDLPLSLLYLQGFLKKEGRQASVVNLAGMQDYLKEIPLDADIYGVTVFTPQHHWAIEIAKYLKKHTKALLVAGGNHVTAIPQDFLEESSFDLVVRGEGEFTLSDICGGKELSCINGISYKENDKIIHNADRDFCKNIDLIPFPSLKGINLDEYGRVHINQGHSKYSIDILTSRGCPRACAFCASSNFWKRKIRLHSTEYIFEYLDYLYQNGINDFNLIDDDFIVNYSRLEKICTKLELMKSVWSCETRSDCVTEKIAALLKKSGCKRVSLGIESASNKVLKLINKEVTAQDHKRAIAIFKSAGLTICGFLIVGLPGEDHDALADTIRFIKEEPVDYYTVSTFVPYPGTPIWKDPTHYGYEFDRKRPYSEYCTISKDLEINSVAKNYRQVNAHRKQLFKALGDKCTNLRSIKFAELQLEKA